MKSLSKTTKNSWSKGLNSDLSKLKSNPENYLDALNIRVLTEKGDSSYAIENTKGTLFSFTLPNIPRTYKLDVRNFTGTINIVFNGPLGTLTINNVEQKTNEQINDEIETFIGLAAINGFTTNYNNKYIVIYDFNNVGINTVTSTTGLVSARNDNLATQRLLGWGHYTNFVVLITGFYNRGDGANAIYVFKIDDTTNQLIGFDDVAIPIGSPLSNLTMLRYVGDLKHFTDAPIYRHVVLRLENNKILRCIWTDGRETLKTINLLDEQVRATPEELIDYLPTNEIQEPIIEEVIEGGFLPSAKYYYFYRLKSLSGAVSTVSPVSNGITLLPNQLNDFINFNGVIAGTSSQKSVKVKVFNPDTNYDIIEFGYVVYQVKDFPEVFIFDEKNIQQSLSAQGFIETTHNGNENDIPLELTAISNINRPPEIFKTIDVVRNRLAAANAKYKNPLYDFNAQVYRYKTIGGGLFKADLYQNNDAFNNARVQITHNGTIYTELSLSGVVTLLPTYNALNSSGLTDNDLINPYNNEDDSDPLNGAVPGGWLANSQYNLNPLTNALGGLGTNISYSFITQDDIADLTTDAAFINITPGVNVSSAVPYNSGNDYPYTQAGSFNTLKSPYKKSLFTGYARGEVYRFGIVFLDLKGYPSDVKWIGDIRFPDHEDSPMSNVLPTNTIITRNLGIEFTVDTTTSQFQAIKDQISGWYFVRLERNETDKTKLGTGILNTLLIGDLRYVENFSTLNSPGGWIPSPPTNVCSLDFPNTHFGIDDKFIQGDYLKIITDPITFMSVPFSHPLTNGRHYYRYVPVDSEYVNSGNLNIDFRWRVDRSYNQDELPADPSNGLSLPYRNMATETQADDALGEYQSYGNLTNIVTLDLLTPYTVPGGNDKIFVSYARYNTAQYNGRLFSNRFNQKYIPVGFMPYKSENGNQGSISLRVFNGDTTVMLYDHQKLDQNFQPITGYLVATLPAIAKGVAFYFPAECHNFNPEHRIIDPLQGFHASTRREDKILLNEKVNVTNRALDNENNYSYFLTPSIDNPTNVSESEPNTIYITENKNDNELVDSWRFFRVNNALTVSGNYGPINRIRTLKDKLYFYQDDAFGRAEVEAQVVVNPESADGAETELGTGGVLSRFDYMSTETGLSNMWAVDSSGNSLYHYDSKISKFFRFNPQEGVNPLSDVKGLFGFFQNRNPILKQPGNVLLERTGDLHVAFNPEFNTVYLTCNRPEDPFTISFNELLNAFESRHSFIASMYLPTRRKFLSTFLNTQTSEQGHIHEEGNRNVYHGSLGNSFIKFRVNENSDISKIFDNFAFNTEVYDTMNANLNETFNTMLVTNDYQTSGIINLIPQGNIKQTIRTWRTKVPLDNTNPSLRLKPRIVDKYIDVALTYNNNTLNSNKQFILHDVLTTYSFRSQILPK